MLSILSVEHLSSTEKTGNKHLSITECINDGINGIMMYGGYPGYDGKLEHRQQLFQEVAEAGMWTCAADLPGGGIGDQQTGLTRLMGNNTTIDFVEIDEPFGINGTCDYRQGHWLQSYNDYVTVRNKVRSVSPNTVLNITDVFCNDFIWNWNIDGIIQEVYADWMYPDYLNKIINYKNTTGRQGYVWLNVMDRQLYGTECPLQSEASFKTWLQASWNNNVKSVLFLFLNRCSGCEFHGEFCGTYGLNIGNNWSGKQASIQAVTAGTRVKFHEWDTFSVSSTETYTPDLSVKVRSSAAGLSPSSVKCYYTNNYKGRWEMDPATETVWTETPCSCTGTEGAKGWETITAENVSLKPGNKNMFRFKIKDLCTSSYYRGNRWAQQQYPITMGTIIVEDTLNLAWAKPCTSSTEHSAVYAAKFANDGDTWSYWISGKESNPYYQVDLGNAYVIGDVELLPNPNTGLFTSASTIEVLASSSADFSDSVVIASVSTDSLDAFESWVDTSSNKGEYRYIRVQAITDTVDATLYLGEIRVYEGEADTVVSVKSLSRSSVVKNLDSHLYIYDLQGKVLRSLPYETQDSDLSSVSFSDVDLSGLESGVYIFRYHRGVKTLQKKIFKE
ncbi:MAG: discoidin domain-containing protein [Fibrobacteria bacterium]|nr:discoidin domain-containing protein [Fibrobacteria bacterium]